MALIAEETASVFDSSAIQRGDFIRAQYHRWDEPHNGLVANVTDDTIWVLYLTDIGNVSNFFTIRRKEVEEGLWSIQWSTDMETVNTTEESEDASDEEDADADA
ncbi:MAG: DUF5026 domain-containing protein [Lachnospiraceae bacterium]|nr:DUF5026 domain-containing protein [Lachnospiraceae bacterium]MCD8196128.1 DUF5026 domain-containing protein [Lachnospiraceae bacterium]